MANGGMRLADRGWRLANGGGRKAVGERRLACGILRLMNATTIICVRRDGRTAMASDGQVTLGTLIVKHQAAKVRRLYEGKILAGFAGSAADGLALVGRFEGKLKEHRGQVERAAVE